MFWGLRQNKYLILVFFIHFIFIVLFTAGEVHRVRVDLQPDFILFRIVNGLIVFCLLLWMLFRLIGDVFYTVSSAVGFFYCIYSSWYLPLYEFAFFQFALAFCFVGYKRRWLYPITQFIGGCLFVISQQWQAKIGWVIPAPTGRDFFLVIVLCLGLAILMQRYLFQARLDKNQMLHRYGIIGREATRLLHDVKGMLGSPILVTSGLLNRNSQGLPPVYEEGLKDLHRDLQNINQVVYNLNRLVSMPEDPQYTSLLGVLKRSITGLGVRIQKVKIELPDERQIFVVATKMESVFFNLLLNSIQAQSRIQKADPVIKIEWRGDSLVYSDNIGSVSEKREDSTGLGFALIEDDLNTMNIAFDYSSSKSEFVFNMKVKS